MLLDVAEFSRGHRIPGISNRGSEVFLKGEVIIHRSRMPKKLHGNIDNLFLKLM